MPALKKLHNYYGGHTIKGMVLAFRYGYSNFITIVSLKTLRMNYIQQIEHWGEVHHPRWMDIVRIGLGVFLCYKGITVLMNMSQFVALLYNSAPFGAGYSSFGVVM